MMSCLTLMPVISSNALASVLRFVFVHRQGFGDRVDLHALEGFSGLDEPLHLLHLVVFRQRRRLKFAVDPFLGRGFVGKDRCGDRGRGSDQRDRARHHQDPGPWSRARYFSLSVACWFLRCSDTHNQARVGPGSALFRFPQTVRKITTAETSEITVASHRLDNSNPFSPIGSVAIVSVPTKPIHSRWMTAAMISETNRRSPRVVGMRSIPTRSASG